MFQIGRTPCLMINYIEVQQRFYYKKHIELLKKY